MNSGVSSDGILRGSRVGDRNDGWKWFRGLSLGGRGDAGGKGERHGCSCRVGAGEGGTCHGSEAREGCIGGTRRGGGVVVKSWERRDNAIGAGAGIIRVLALARETVCGLTGVLTTVVDVEPADGSVGLTDDIIEGACDPTESGSEAGAETRFIRGTVASLVTEVVGTVCLRRAGDISATIEPSRDGLDRAVDGVHRGRLGLPFCCGLQISGSKRDTLRRRTYGERQRQHRRRETEQQSRGP